MAKDTIHLGDLGHDGMPSSIISENESSLTDMVVVDSQIYQGAIGYNQRVSTDTQQTSGNDDDVRKEEHNLLYAQTASSATVNRHPTVRTLSEDRPVMCSVDSLNAIPPSRNFNNRCLTVLLVITGVLATVAVIAAVLAYISVLGDECTCDTPNRPLTEDDIGERLQLLEQNAAKINMTTNFSQIMDNLLSEISNLNSSINVLKGPEGDEGPRGENGTNGPEGSPGDQGIVGSPGIDGYDGPMGINGLNAMLNFRNVNLFEDCIATRNTCDLTSAITRCNIGITTYPGDSVILERACMITPAANATATILPSNIVQAVPEQCSCTTTITGDDTAECILTRLECRTTQITLTQT